MLSPIAHDESGDNVYTARRGMVLNLDRHALAGLGVDVLDKFPLVRVVREITASEAINRHVPRRVLLNADRHCGVPSIDKGYAMFEWTVGKEVLGYHFPCLAGLDQHGAERMALAFLATIDHMVAGSDDRSVKAGIQAGMLRNEPAGFA